MLASWQQPYCPQCNMSSETNGRILLAPGRSASGPVGRFLRGEEAGCQREQAVWFMRQAARAYGSQVLAAPGEAGTAGPEALQLDCGAGRSGRPVVVGRPATGSCGLRARARGGEPARPTASPSSSQTPDTPVTRCTTPAPPATTTSVSAPAPPKPPPTPRPSSPASNSTAHEPTPRERRSVPGPAQQKRRRPRLTGEQITWATTLAAGLGFRWWLWRWGADSF